MSLQKIEYLVTMQGRKIAKLQISEALAEWS